MKIRLFEKRRGTRTIDNANDDCRLFGNVRGLKLSLRPFDAQDQGRFIHGPSTVLRRMLYQK